MPTYEYECSKGHLTETFRRMDERDDAPKCDECSAKTKRVMSAVRGFVSFPAGAGQEYVSPASGRYISTMRARRDDMARTGSRPWEGMESETKAAKRRVAEDEKKSDAVLHDNVSKAYHSLSPDKKKVLG